MILFPIDMAALIKSFISWSSFFWGLYCTFASMSADTLVTGVPHRMGFIRCGTPVTSVSALIDANVQYKPQKKDDQEMNDFINAAMSIGNRIIVIDEFNNYQKSKYITNEMALF